MSATSKGIMSQFPLRPWARGLSLFFALSMSGCHSWTPYVLDLGPNPYSQRLRVTTSDTRVEIHNARIENDTLLVGIELLRNRASAPFSVPLVQVKAIERRRYSRPKTFVLAAVAAAAMLAVAVAESFSNFSLSSSN